jgi:hypothetical protein
VREHSTQVPSQVGSDSPVQHCLDGTSVQCLRRLCCVLCRQTSLQGAVWPTHLGRRHHRRPHHLCHRHHRLERFSWVGEVPCMCVLAARQRRAGPPAAAACLSCAGGVACTTHLHCPCYPMCCCAPSANLPGVSPLQDRLSGPVLVPRDPIPAGQQ